MAVQPDGKIVVAGEVANAERTESDAFLARFLADGRPTRHSEDSGVFLSDSARSTVNYRKTNSECVRGHYCVTVPAMQIQFSSILAMCLEAGNIHSRQSLPPSSVRGRSRQNGRAKS